MMVLMMILEMVRFLMMVSFMVARMVGFLTVVILIMMIIRVMCFMASSLEMLFLNNMMTVLRTSLFVCFYLKKFYLYKKLGSSLACNLWLLEYSVVFHEDEG